MGQEQRGAAISLLSFTPRENTILRKWIRVKKTVRWGGGRQGKKGQGKLLFLLSRGEGVLHLKLVSKSLQKRRGGGKTDTRTYP